MGAARFLVLRGGALGDFIVTLPALAALRERWPDAEIELVGYPHFAQLAREAGLVNRVSSLHGAQIARFFSLRPDFPDEQVQWLRSFDFVLNYLHDPDGVVVDNLKRAGARTVLVGSPIIEQGHAMDVLVKPLESLAVYAAGAAARLDLGPAARAKGRAQAGLEEPFVVLHPGSGSLRKNWPLDRYVALAQHLHARRGWTPVFLTGEADEAIAAQLAVLAPALRHLRNLEISAVARVLSAAAFYVGNDSGITHLAAAVGAPTLALFGPTNPQQWAPRGEQVRVLHAPGGELAALSVEDVGAYALASG